MGMLIVVSTGSGCFIQPANSRKTPSGQKALSLAIDGLRYRPLIWNILRTIFLKPFVQQR
jgi:hypothetical protein